MESVWL